MAALVLTILIPDKYPPRKHHGAVEGRERERKMNVCPNGTKPQLSTMV